jgi:CHAT domain-containing protein
VHTPSPRFWLSLLLVVTTILLCPIRSQGDSKNPSSTELAAMEKECLAAETHEACQKAISVCTILSSKNENNDNSRERELMLATIYSQLLRCESMLGLFPSAEKHGYLALSLRKKWLLEDDPQLAKAMSNLANILADQGKYDAADRLIRRSAQILRQQLGIDHEMTIIVLHNFANILNNQGKHLESEQLHREVLQSRRRRFGNEHLHVAYSLTGLASALLGQGKYDDAAALSHESVEILKKNHGENHTSVAIALQNLGNILREKSNYCAAESAHTKSLSILRKHLSEDHPLVSAAINNLANDLNAIGKQEQAIFLYYQSLRSIEKHFDTEHPQIATTLHNIACMLASQGDLRKAEYFHRKALFARRKRLSAHHPDIASSLSYLASSVLEQGRYAEAESLYRTALNIRLRFLGDKHLDVAISLHNLAVSLERQKRYLESNTHFRRAIAIISQPGRNNLYWETPKIMSAFGYSLLKQGRIRQSLDESIVAAVISEELLRVITGESQIRALIQSIRDQEDFAYSILSMGNGSDRALRFSVSLALLRKGRPAELASKTNRIINSLINHDIHLRILFDEWCSARQRLESLLFAENDPSRQREEPSQHQAIAIQVESLEAQLAQSIPEIRTLQPPKFDDIIPEVAKRIPKDGALVEVVWTRPYQVKAKDEASRWGAPRFVALLLYPDRRIVSVDLGLAAELDEKGRELLAALRTPQSDPKSAAQAMYRKLFAPLLPHLAGKKEVYLSLDGSLHLIPFAALHDGSDYLLGKYHFHYLTSGRDLLREPSKRSPSAALVLADPDFGPIEPATTPAQSAPTMSIYQRLATLTPLPAAQVEAEQIAPLLGVKPLLGSAAREEVIHDAHAPWILHLATHGLFLGDVELPVFDDRTRSSLLALVPPPAPKSVTQNTEQLPGEVNAMNRSTLVLAGVRQGQRASSLKQDGLLTAENSRSLDLDGTQLVVLSACDSGVGTTSTGQGIYGLRRGFLVAGAETVVTSLWRVDDQATGELMVQYYRKLLDPKNPGDRLRAMEESMQELRSRRAHPYYWAPFLVIGQDGPLRRP